VQAAGGADALENCGDSDGLSGVRQTSGFPLTDKKPARPPTLAAVLARLTPERTVTALLCVGVATLACLSPVHNDTWWHLRYGQEMSRSGGFAQVDVFSFTAFGQRFPNHEWLGERFLYGCFALGGLPGVTAACAAIITVGWWLSWRMMRGALTDRVLIFVAALMASTSIWSIRPQVFTILLLPLTATLVSADVLWPVPLLTLVWANLHGGVLVGLVTLAAATVVQAMAQRGRLPARHLATLAASLAATCVTPLGLQYWPEILASLRRSRANGIIEWRPPQMTADYLIFWGGAVFFLWLALTRWRRLEASADRMQVGGALALLGPATQAIRNIPTFAILGAPAVSRLVAADVSHTRPTQSRPHNARAGAMRLTAVVLAIATASFGIARAWSQPWSRLGWKPMSPAAGAAVDTCRSPIYNEYGDGGPLIWFARQNRVFLDSRQDPFPVSLVQAATEVERTGDYLDLFARWHINCAALPVDSPTASRLLHDGWTIRFRDAQWTVFERARPATTGGLPSSEP
jgi:hypothetical protein